MRQRDLGFLIGGQRELFRRQTFYCCLYRSCGEFHGFLLNLVREHDRPVYLSKRVP